VGEVEPTRHVARAFKTLGENIVESLTKGDRVFAHGTVTTEAWTDKHSGEKRTTSGYSPRSSDRACGATTRITKTNRTRRPDEAPHDVSGQEG